MNGSHSDCVISKGSSSVWHNQSNSAPA